MLEGGPHLVGYLERELLAHLVRVRGGVRGGARVRVASCLSAHLVRVRVRVRVGVRVRVASCLQTLYASSCDGWYVPGVGLGLGSGLGSGLGLGLGLGSGLGSELGVGLGLGW